MTDSPLDGLTILDLSRVLSGPFCTMLLAGTLPDRQPSSSISVRRSDVSSVRCRLPFTRTTTASSPNSLLNRSVSLNDADDRFTSVSVEALG